MTRRLPRPVEANYSTECHGLAVSGLTVHVLTVFVTLLTEYHLPASFRLHNLVTQRRQDKENLALLERKLEQERKQRASVEQQLISERKAAKRIEEQATARAIAMAAAAR